MTRPTRMHDGPETGTLIDSILERPIGIGLGIGILAGIVNAIALGFTLVPSAIVGAALGILVCVVACPRMRAFLKRRRFLLKQYAIALSTKSRRAFTSLD